MQLSHHEASILHHAVFVYFAEDVEHFGEVFAYDGGQAAPNRASSKCSELPWKAG
jgi:hypothetical protein